MAPPGQNGRALVRQARSAKVWPARGGPTCEKWRVAAGAAGDYGRVRSWPGLWMAFQASFTVTGSTCRSQNSMFIALALSDGELGVGSKPLWKTALVFATGYGAGTAQRL